MRCALFSASFVGEERGGGFFGAYGIRWVFFN